MYCKEKSLINTATVTYQYAIDSGTKTATKVSSASVSTQVIVPCDYVSFRPLQLVSCVSFDTPGCRTLIDLKYDIITDHLTLVRYSRYYNRAVLRFTLHINSVYFNYTTNKYEPFQWYRRYRRDLLIPVSFADCEADFTILRNSLITLNPCTARNVVIVQIIAFTEHKEEIN